MLNFIIGRAGTGKTYMTRKIVLEKLRLNETKLLLLVPEQISFENEKLILNLVGAKSSRFINVVSFTSLTTMVSRLTGGFAGKRLDDSARSMIMSLAIEKVKPNLNIYKRHSGKIEFVNLMIQTAKEFKACGISQDDILKTVPKIENPSLRYKLEETSMIINAYDTIVKQSYSDPLDDLTRLYNILLENDVFSGYTVFVDSFVSFTNQQLKVLECILKQATDTYVSLCADSTDWNETDIDIFSESRHTASQLIKIAKNSKIKISKPLNMNDNYRFSNRELKFVEAGIFRSNKKTYNEITDKICIFKAQNVYDEFDFVARHIKKLIYEEKYNYRDIVVIARSTQQYEEVVDSVFSKCDIPFFMDRREPIDQKPLVSLILTIFDVIINKFRSDHIFKMLKTGLLSFSVEEISLLENYVLLWNITGETWLSDFKLHPRGFVEKFSDEDSKTLILLNNIRDRVIAPLKKFTDGLQEKNGKNISKMIYLLLEDLDVGTNITEYSKTLESIGEINLSQEQFRLWDTVMQVLDQIATVINDKKISLRRYKELLKVSVNSRDIAFIPQRLDEVKFGSADRIRPNHPKVVFIVGAAQGEFPAYPSDRGVFNDVQRKDLLSLGLKLHDSLERISIREQFTAYMSMTSASERLFVSWSVNSSSGTARHPSSIVRECMKILPKTQILSSEREDQIDFLFSEKASFEQYAKHFKDRSKFTNTLKDYFSKNESYKLKAQVFDMLSKPKNKNVLEKSSVQKLFNNEMCISASQVEKFYLCKFQYFCKYGVHAEKRKPAVFDALQFGNLVHFVLEDVFSKKCLKENIESEVSKSLNKYLNKKLGGIENKTSRFKYLFSRLETSIKILVTYIFEKSLKSNFKPVDFELEFKEGSDIPPLKIDVPDGGTVKIEGKVDRIDVMREQGKVYLRIVDYKTGAKQFNLSDVLYGINMQMLIYLVSIMKNGKRKYGEIIPAGVLYMPTTLKVATIDRDVQIIDQIDKKRLDSQFNMNGIILDDPNVVSELGQNTKDKTLVTLNEMGKILKKVESLVTEMSKSLQEGDMSISPLSGNVNSCEYCDYSSVCGFENLGNCKKVESLDPKLLMLKF